MPSPALSALSDHGYSHRLRSACTPQIRLLYSSRLQPLRLHCLASVCRRPPAPVVWPTRRQKHSERYIAPPSSRWTEKRTKQPPTAPPSGHPSKADPPSTIDRLTSRNPTLAPGFRRVLLLTVFLFPGSSLSPGLVTPGPAPRPAP